MTTTVRPNIVYKYHRANQYLVDLLTNGQFWFSHQNELNDPFDCKYALSDSFLISLLKKSSNDVFIDLQKGIPQFKDVSQDKFFELMLPILKTNEWMNGFYNMLFGGLMGWSVSCFTTKALNELMWAHYADNNKGVCLEFDLSKTPELHEKLNKVIYEDTFPEINSMDELPKALLTKRTAWSREDEWRILANVKGVKSFNKESLTAIYFGYNVSKQTIDNIKKILINSGYTKVDFKQFNFRFKGVTLTPMDKDDPFQKL